MRLSRDLFLSFVVALLALLVAKSFGVLTLSWGSIVLPLALVGAAVGSIYSGACLLQGSENETRESFKRWFCGAPQQSTAALLDPWEMQHRLMEASDQPMPETASFTKGSVLYARMKMEEMSETFEELVSVITRIRVDNAHIAVEGEDSELWAFLRHSGTVIDRARMELELGAENLKEALEWLPGDFEFPLLAAEAKELLDGTADETVVNCGFALSCGLPGAAGYYEVARSNLSKRNPDTWKIDKDASGKWIKGRDFFEPDLLTVLREARAID